MVFPLGWQQENRRKVQMKLFISEGSPQCVKVLAALEHTGVKCDVQLLSHEGEKVC